jgi:hypothetical protein
MKIGEATITNKGKRTVLAVDAPMHIEILSFDENGEPFLSKGQKLSPEQQQKLKIDQLKG